MHRNEPDILLIDDDPAFLELFALLLGSHGARITTAGSAAEALRLLGERTFDLVVSDCDMPEISGPALRRQLRVQRRGERTPIVFLSALEPGPDMPRPFFQKTAGLEAIAEHMIRLALTADEPMPAALPPARAHRLTRLLHALRPRVARAVKRTFDIAVAGTATAFIAPFAAVIALAIWLEDRGPVFYGQTRVGLGGRTFRMWKFRSMRRDADRMHAAIVSDDGNDIRKKVRRDPRVTRVGRFLRRYSIDELPQFLNVLCGDMSIVGPRPPIPAEVARYDAAAWHRLDVKPGLTCIWQVSGRADVPFPEQVRMDSEYVLDRSLRRDLELIARTFPAVLGGKGAY